MKRFMMVLLFTHTVQASTTLGLGMAGNSSTYNYKDNVSYSALPLIGYGNKYFSFSFPKVNLFFYNDEFWRLSFLTVYDGQKFNPKYAVRELRGIKKRDSEVFYGIEYNFRILEGELGLQIIKNIRKSYGEKANFSWQRSFSTGSWQFQPGVGVEWNSRKQNHYYYSVDEREALKTSVQEYDLNSTLTPYTNASLTYSFDGNWNLSIYTDVHFIPERQKKSPLTSNSDIVYGFGGVISYVF